MLLDRSKRILISGLSWVGKNSTSIYVGMFVSLVFATILLVREIEYTTKEFGHALDKSQIIESYDDLVKDLNGLEDFSNFQDEVINNLKEVTTQQEMALIQARSLIAEQSDTLVYQKAVIEKLVEYLKKIGKWPPDIDPPKPVDPSRLADESRNSI
tara:strand:- start:28071 stop:28538 length:468 start_codon:yes stop_codon:yes gene_type:complete